jgi:hypothetical protein
MRRLGKNTEQLAMTSYESNAGYVPDNSKQAMDARAEVSMLTTPVVFPDGSAVWSDDSLDGPSNESLIPTEQTASLTHAASNVAALDSVQGVTPCQVCHHHYHHVAGGRWLVALTTGVAIALLSTPLIMAHWPTLARPIQNGENDAF